MPDPAAKTFVVIRQDSNGNHFVEAKSLSKECADVFLDRRQREIGDHHQTIWKQNAELPLPQPLYDLSS